MTEPEQLSDILPKHIVLIAKHFGTNSGGEAIKAFQFAKYLRERGVALTVVTHQRAVNAQGATEVDAEFLVVPDTGMQRFFWRVRPLRGLLDVYFHVYARKLINAHARKVPDAVLHYIGPVSPVALRFLPRDRDIVLGPLTGNIYYPPGFRARAPRRYRIAERLHLLSQRVLGVVFPEKKRARAVLVSGYERTRVSLRLAGVSDTQMIDVVDSGVSDSFLQRDRITHSGVNHKFVCIGRMVDYKGFDFAIRAVAQADPATQLDVYGDGEKRSELETMTRELGLADRVHFKGWVQSDDPEMLDSLAQYRGYLFPSIAEANGIVMQEAMMLGLPVVATRWGGPERLADDETALYVDPISDAHMVSEFAKAMDRLAVSPDFADQISARARETAETSFGWGPVAESWIKAGYRGTSH